MIPTTLLKAKPLVAQANNAGMHATLTTFDQSSGVNQLLAGEFSVALVRNFHSDPAYGDTGSYIWFSKGSPLNFSKFDDSNVQAALDAGRFSPLMSRRSKKAYEDFSRAKWRTASTQSLRGTTPAPSPRVDSSVRRGTAPRRERAARRRWSLSPRRVCKK